MEESIAALAPAIGVRITQERPVRRGTLERLAEVAGVSHRMIGSIEQDAVKLSVRMLLRIRDARCRATCAGRAAAAEAGHGHPRG